MSNPDISSIYDLNNDELSKAEHYRKENKIIVRVGNSDTGEPIRAAIVDDISSTHFATYDEALSVEPAELTEVLFYTVPPASCFCLEMIDVSGDNRAKFTVKINGSVSKVKRIGYGEDFNTTFHYSQCDLVAGDTIQVEVIHYQDLGHTGDFNATLEGRVKDA